MRIKMIQNPQAVDIVKHGVDAVSIGSLALVMGDILTPIVLILTLVWTGIRIYNAFLDTKIKRKELYNEDDLNKK